MFSAVSNFVCSPIVVVVVVVVVVKEDEVDRACSKHGGDNKCIQNFGWKT